MSTPRVLELRHDNIVKNQNHIFFDNMKQKDSREDKNIMQVAVAAEGQYSGANGSVIKGKTY